MKTVASHFQRKIELDRPKTDVSKDVQRRLWTTLSRIREHPDSENVVTAMFPDRGRVTKIRRRTKNEGINTPASQSIARSMYPSRGHVQQRRWSDVDHGDEEMQTGPKLYRLKSTSDDDWDWDLSTKISRHVVDDVEDDNDDDKNDFKMNSSRIEQVRNGSSILTWKERLGLCIQLCSGVSYLHRQVPIILHRDLKPHNVLLSEDFCVKICDFGESRHFSRASSKTGDGKRRFHLFRSCLPSCIQKEMLKSERDELDLLSDVELPLTIRGSPLW